MGKLSAFLHPVAGGEEKEIVISRRFLDGEGNPIKFKIRAITQEENDAITKRATRTVKVDGTAMSQLDSGDYARRLVVQGTVEPDFAAKELCDAYGVADPLLTPGKMLLAGEYARLLKAITDLSGFDEPEDEVKN